MKSKPLFFNGADAQPEAATMETSPLNDDQVNQIDNRLKQLSIHDEISTRIGMRQRKIAQQFFKFTKTSERWKSSTNKFNLKMLREEF